MGKTILNTIFEALGIKYDVNDMSKITEIDLADIS